MSEPEVFTCRKQNKPGVAPPPGPVPRAERKEIKRKTMAKAREVLRLRKIQVDAIKEKVKLGLEITPEENAMLAVGPRKSKVTRAQAASSLMDMASKLVIKPQTVQALRLVVEQTAARHKYNPIDELIRLTKSADLGDKDKVAIHKALMPFLIPTVGPAPTEEEATPEDQRPKIIIKNFHMGEREVRPIHESKRDSLAGPEIIVEDQTK